MSYEVKRKRYKKYVMEIEFLRAELSYQEEILSIAHQDFELAYRQWCDNNNVNLEKLNQEQESRISKIISQPKIPDLKFNTAGILVLDKQVQKAEKKRFTKLFKQVAKATHPDRHKDTALDFKAASAAFEMGDWSLLIQIAEKHGIFPEDFEELIPTMKEEIRRLKKMIKHNEGIYSWKFSECQSEDCKEQLIKQFLKQLFNLEL
tara:strand:- start:101 stop:715 length:615 start_codon:yes stop_codon:yes gene_type:complete